MKCYYISIRGVVGYTLRKWLIPRHYEVPSSVSTHPLIPLYAVERERDKERERRKESPHIPSLTQQNSVLFQALRN